MAYRRVSAVPAGSNRDHKEHDVAPPFIPKAGRILGSPSIDEVLRELDSAEELVNTFAIRAKCYWMEWGPVGVPMILGIDVWARGQLQNLKWLRAGVLEL